MVVVSHVVQFVLDGGFCLFDFVVCASRTPLRFFLSLRQCAFRMISVQNRM